MERYLAGIFHSRYFWMHLALSDLRSKWRRSFMGMLWSIIQPLGLTPLLSYAPYVLYDCSPVI